MITESMVRAAIKRAVANKGKSIEIRDGGERGAGRLVLQVRARDEVVTSEFYAVFHRGGRRRYVKLGSYPSMSIKDARQKFTEEYAPVISAGANPASENVRRRHNADRATATVEELFKGYVADLRRAGKRTAGAIEAVLLTGGSNAADSIGRNRLASTVGPADIVSHLKDIYDRGATTQAALVRAYIGAAFNFGLKSEFDYRADGEAPSWGLTTNPVAAVKSDPGAFRAGDRVLTTVEWKSYWDWLGDYQSRSLMGYAGRIHLATGQRVEEVLRMSPAGYDRGTKLYEWSETKNGLPHSIPLPQAVIDILEELPANKYGWYFPNRDKPEDPVSYLAMWRAVAQFCKESGTAHFVPKDVRRTWKTLAGQAGLSKEIRDKLQNHAQRNDVSSKHYDKYDYLTEKRAGMEKWETFMGRIISGDLDAVVVRLGAAA